MITDSMQDEQAVFTDFTALAATKLKQHLEKNDHLDVDKIVDEIQLSYQNAFFIFIIDPQGNEILGRDLSSVDTFSILPQPEPKKITLEEGLGGYKVIGYNRIIPVSALVSQTGFRLLVIVCIITLTFAVAYGLSQFIARPIKKLRHAGQRVADGDLSVRVAQSVKGRNDDIAIFAKEFDHMTSRIEELLTNQKRLMRDVSHELRSPLARLQAHISVLRQRTEKDELYIPEKDLNKLDKESERINSLIERILTYAKLDRGAEIKLQKIDIIDLLQMIADDACFEGLPEQKDVIVTGPDRCIVYVDIGLMQSALENIVRNGLRYTKPGTVVDVVVRDKASDIEICISDSGPGINAAIIDKIFEPFFRADQSREHGTGGGIGLAIAERAVKLHRGKIWAVNRDGGGLSVLVTFPKECLAQNHR